MGEVIPFLNRARDRRVEKALRLLIRKARAGHITGLAFVAVRENGTFCTGTVDLPDQDEALGAAGHLMDTILGKEAFTEL